MIRYFAYGSNIDLPALQEYLATHNVDPDAVSRPHRAILHGYRLRTNYVNGASRGAANIERHSTWHVEGVLMDISSSAIKALRRKEGWPRRYREVLVIVEVPALRQIVIAMTYVVTPEHRLGCDMPVSVQYRDAILKGAAAFRFSSKYVARLRSLLRCR